MSQKDDILRLLRNSPDGVSCATLAQNGLYHHGSQRIGEMCRQGFVINFVKGMTWDTGRYILKQEPPQTNRKAVDSLELRLTGEDIGQEVGPW